MACSIADWPRGGELCSEPFSAQEEMFFWVVGYFLQKCHKERQRLGTGDKRWRSVDFSFGGATWILFLSLDQEDCGCRFGIHVLAHTASKAPHSDCRGKIDFEDCYGSTLKTLGCRLRCVSAGSHFEVKDFLSDTELDYFLRNGFFIVCRLRISPSNAEEAPSRPDIGDVPRSAAGEADRPDPTRSRLPGGDPTAFLEDAVWPRGGDYLRRKHPSPWVTAVSWKIGSFLRKCRAARESSGSSCKKLKSRDFSFGDATFTLFMSLDAREERSRIGIHFRTSVSSDEEFVCRSEIHTKSFWSKFRCESAEYHWTVSDFLSHSELDMFLSEGDDIFHCTISRQTRSNREACSRTEVPSSSMSSTLDAHSQTEHLENEDKDEKKAGKEDEDAMVKLCQDIKNFFSEDHSDSDGTDDVRDLLLRTHRSMRRVRKARRNHTFTESRRHGKDDGEAVLTTTFDNKVYQDFKNLLLNEEFSDVTMKVGGQDFKAHWSILVARSPVFASMLRHDTQEKATGVVNVKDCELSSFPVFLECVYCGRTEKISSENVFNLYVAADKYDVQDLKWKCLEFMKTNISVDNFCETLHLSLRHSENKLLKFATDFFIKNFRQIILTPKWQSFLSGNPIQGNELFIKATSTSNDTA